MADKKNGVVQCLDAFDIWYAEGGDLHLFIGIVRNDDEGTTAFVFTVKNHLEEARKAFEAEGVRVLHVTYFSEMLSDLIDIPRNGYQGNQRFQ